MHQTSDGSDAVVTLAPSVLFERFISPANIARARRRVVGNGGAPGSDGMGAAELDESFDRLWPSLEDALRLGTYLPAPLREVEIPKPDGGNRVLRIPTVADRVVLQAIAQVLLPVWEPALSRSSYAYRCGRGALEAVGAARERIGDGLGWVVHLDIVKYFDRVDLRALSGQLRQRIDDDLMLDLIDRVLQQGSLPSGRDPEPDRRVGLPQGSPLSPLLANIALDPFDCFLEGREVAFLRYADDIILLCHDEADAARHLEAARKFLEAELLLELHPGKSRISPPHDAEFLGFSFPSSHDGSVRVAVSSKAKARFEAELEQCRHRWRKSPFETVARKSAERIEQWLGYYGSAGTVGERQRCQAAARRMLRRWLWEEWGDAERRRRELVRLGVSPAHVDRCLAEVGSAEEAAEHPFVAAALPNAFFARYGLGEGRKRPSQPGKPASAATPRHRRAPANPPRHATGDGARKRPAAPASGVPIAPLSVSASTGIAGGATGSEAFHHVERHPASGPEERGGMRIAFDLAFGRLRFCFHLGAGMVPAPPGTSCINREDPPHA